MGAQPAHGLSVPGPRPGVRARGRSPAEGCSARRARRRRAGARSRPRPAPALPQDTSRIQGFSDGVFALAATLLVVTLEVPRTYDELIHVLGGFPAFALAFMALLSLWSNHRQFFDSYPVADGWVVGLNGVLLFTVLLYVYPLKLLAEVAAESFFGVPPHVTEAMGPAEIRGLYLIFGAAVVVVLGLMLLLHLRAWRARAALGLDRQGRAELRQEILTYGLICGLGVASLGVAAAGLGLAWGAPLWVLLLSPLVVVGVHLGGGTRGRPRGVPAGRAADGRAADGQAAGGCPPPGT
jgi:hypothetical protein